MFQNPWGATNTALLRTSLNLPNMGRVLKTGIYEFPSVFECSRVLNLAINAHEIILVAIT